MEEWDGLSSFLSERRDAVTDARMREDGRTESHYNFSRVRSFVPFPSFPDTDFNWREEQVG